MSTLGDVQYMGCSDIPSPPDVLMIFPDVLMVSPPDVLMIFPDVLMVSHDVPNSPRVLNIPRCTEYTLYRV